MEIRRYRDEDAEDVSALIIYTLRVTNIRDYTEEYIEELVLHMRPEDIRERAAEVNFYVVKDGGKTVGCGGIGPYWGRTDEGRFTNIFVHPGYQGRGIGKLIVKTLESDGFASQVRRIEVPASVTARDFYIRLGYNYRNGETAPNEDRLVILEKFL